MSFQKGFALPLVIVFSLVILSALGVWYRQVVIQSFLSEQLFIQHAVYQECWSLVPLLREELDKSDRSSLLVEQLGFYSLVDEGNIIWTVDRSEMKNDLIILTFRNLQQPLKSVTLPIYYKR